MKKRIITMLLCLSIVFGTFAGLLPAVGAASAVTGIQTAGVTKIKVGESVTWTATPVPADAKTKLTWTAGNPGVATVDQNGKITAKKAGQCNITVSASNGVKKTVMLTVTGKAAAATASAEKQSVSASYILNTNTRKFHVPGCSSVKKMKEKNKSYFSGSRADVIAKGYSPCKRCKP